MRCVIILFFIIPGFLASEVTYAKPVVIIIAAGHKSEVGTPDPDWALKRDMANVYQMVKRQNQLPILAAFDGDREKFNYVDIDEKFYPAYHQKNIEEALKEARRNLK